MNQRLTSDTSQLHGTNPQFLSLRLRELLGLSGYEGVDGIQQLVDRYLQGPPKQTFAGRLFDDLEPNPHAKYSLADIAAASLLDVRFSPKAVYALITVGQCNTSLADIPFEKPLWELDDMELHALRSAYDDLKNLPNVGPTKASKLLARKRPLSAPITDSVVEKVLDTDGWAHLDATRKVLRNEPDLVDRLSFLADGRVTPLRVLDIAIWMLGSRSTSATNARAEILGSGDAYYHPNRKQ